MFPRSPSVLCLATVGLLFAGTAWLVSLSEQSGRFRADSDWEREAILARVATRAVIVDEILAGRMSLLEAAARFRDLDRGPPPILWDRFRAYYPGDSDDERHCREVIGNVRARVEDRGGRGRGQVLRLEAELRQHLERGTLRLPETPSPPDGRAAPAVSGEAK